MRGSARMRQRRCPCRCRSFVSEPALRRINKMAEIGHAGASQLATYWVGQGVGLMDQAMSCGQVVQQFREDFLEARERLIGLLDEG